jgi:hypothetical protein
MGWRYEKVVGDRNVLRRKSAFQDEKLR